MIKTISVIHDIIKKVGYVLNSRQKYIGLIVVIMTIINAILQTLGVSIIVPVVSMMTSPNETMSMAFVQKICNVFHISNASAFFVFLCLGVIVLYLIKNAFCLFQLWVSTKYSCLVQRELSASVLKAYMGRTYDFFLNYGTAKIIRDVQTDTFGVNRIITYGVSLLTEILTMLLIIIYIVAMDWRMAMCLMILAGTCIFVINAYFKKKMRKAGEESRIKSAETQKVLLEAIEGIKEVQAMRKQPFFISAFERAYLQEQKPDITQRIISTCPTYLIEAVFVSGMMAFICIRMIMDPNYTSAIPMLASFLVGAVRMLPSLGRVSGCLTGFSFNLPSLNSVYDNIHVLRQESQDDTICDDIGIDVKYDFSHELQLKNICWHYVGADNNVLSSLNLTIKKGESIGIIGQSGAGKSTLADIILGLHLPQAGQIFVDDVPVKSITSSYCSLIGYVPQNIYLIDGTIRENVAFGVDQELIDDEAIWISLKQAQLDKLVSETEYGLDTIVGERGVKFSGGQRQRLAIARALYRKPQILVLDEATSALDNDTEASVMEAIEGLYGTITMIIIAHRLTTVKKCDAIYEIVDGKAVRREKKDIFDNII